MVGAQQWAGGVRGGRSRSPLQEAGSNRSGAMLQALGWEEGASGSVKQGRQEPSPHCSGEEGTAGEDTLEESLRCPYVPPSHDWCVSVN